jgi:hypothetical protein
MKNNRYMNWFFAALLAVAGFSMVACEDEPDKYEVAGGKPTVKYVRVPDVAASDSLLTGAYMENTICLVGDNLRSIYELYFNDQKAVLNTSYITDHTLMVNVPKNIPSVVTDKIYMVTQSQDTVTYDFKVLVPAPAVNSMSCEFAQPGTEVTLIGDYFIDDPNVPLTITMAGNVEVTNITNITKTAVSFILPDNAPAGYINVESIYGVGRSKFRYYDTRNILFDWDGSHGGLATGHGWRDGSKVLKPADENSIDGAYICFSGDLAGAIGATWAEDAFSFNYWPDPDNGYPELSSRPEFAAMLEEYGVNNLQLKFEVNVPSSNPWQSCGMQVIFTGNDVVTNATGTNAYFSDTNVPRGIWIPWKNTGSYDTGGKWTTVSMNLSEFNKTHEGNKCDVTFDKTMLTGVTFFVWAGGVAGQDCSPAIMIDNIRIVPIE